MAYGFLCTQKHLYEAESTEDSKRKINTFVLNTKQFNIRFSMQDTSRH